TVTTLPPIVSPDAATMFVTYTGLATRDTVESKNTTEKLRKFTTVLQSYGAIMAPADGRRCFYIANRRDDPRGRTFLEPRRAGDSTHVDMRRIPGQMRLCEFICLRTCSFIRNARRRSCPYCSCATKMPDNWAAATISLSFLSTAIETEPATGTLGTE